MWRETSSGWGQVRFDELDSPGGEVIAEGAPRLYAGGLLTDTLTLSGPEGPRPVRATVCDRAGNCVSTETSIALRPPESVPPCVTSLTLDGGAAQTSSGTISITVTAGYFPTSAKISSSDINTPSSCCVSQKEHFRLQPEKRIKTAGVPVWYPSPCKL